METIHLTRAQHDSIMSNYPQYMKTKWMKLEKRWSLGGISVTGTSQEIWVIRGFLEAIENIRNS